MLVVVLLALVGSAVLIAGLSFVARLDDGLSMSARESHRALAAAELAVWTAVTAFDSSHFSAARGEERPLPAPAAGVDSVRAGVVRLADSLFAFIGEGGARTAGGAFLWHRVGVLATAALDSAGMAVVTPLPHRAWVELE